jgi:hypothetical protein
MNTKEFIEKVSKAKEIQALWLPQNGDYIYFKPNIERIQFVGNHILYKEYIRFLKENKPWHGLGIWHGYYLSGYKYSMIALNDIKNLPWLPTLEQLFGMLCNQGHQGYDNSGFLFGLSLFGDEHEELSDILYFKDYLLHIVMWRKYNKQWNPDKREWEVIV